MSAPEADADAVPTGNLDGEGDGEAGAGLEPPSPSAQRLIAQAVRQAQRGTRLFDGLIQQVAGLDDDELGDCGELAHDAHVDEGKLLTEGPYVERAERLAGPVFELAQRPFTWTVSVIEDDTLNAFATAGGYVYLHTGLMDALDDGQLTFVLGHEVGHIELAHTDSVWTYAQRLGLLTGPGISGLAMALLSQHVGAGYSELQELEADAWGVEKTAPLGVAPADAIASFEILAAEAGDSIEEEPEPANVLEELERQRRDHYRTHPPAAERIARMKVIVASESKP